MHHKPHFFLTGCEGRLRRHLAE